MTERIPFEVAISDEKLLKKHFDTLSRPQQVILKAFNGLPLGEEELLTWAMLQGSATFDHLGYVANIDPIAYAPEKYDTLVAILGRRSGKTDRITSTQLAYEAILGGHMSPEYVEQGQDVKILFIAQDLGMAASHLKFVYNAIRSSPLLLKEVSKFNADSLLLRSGLKIEPAPPTIKGARGMAVPGWCGDEVGFWYKDAASANPDAEVEAAVEYAMAQFPDAFKFITSTPYTKEGLLWKYHLAGTNGVNIRCEACASRSVRVCVHRAEDKEEYDGVLVVHAPTAAMDNPRFMHAKGRRRLVQLQKRDPDKFIRESLAKFVDSISGFLNAETLRKRVATGVTERERYPRPGHPEDPTFHYIAAMDPAFRHDKFAFTIMHHSFEEGIVQDYFYEWTPIAGVPLNPKEVLAEIKLKLDQFGLSMIYSDQYQLESLQQLALDQKFSIIGVDFTASSKAKIYGSLATLVNTGRIRLLDKPTIYDQLVALEKKRTANGAVTISAPNGKYDDAAAATALCTAQCIWLLPTLAVAKAANATHVQEGWDQIQRKRREALEGPDDGEDFDG